MKAPLLIAGAAYRDADGGRWRVVRVSEGYAVVRSLAAPTAVEIHTANGDVVTFSRAGQAIEICPRPIGWRLEIA